MKITVKVLQGTECTLEVTDATRVGELKEQLEHTTNVSPAAQRLVYKGKTLTDESSLCEAGIGEGAKVHLMVRKGDPATPPAAATSSRAAQVDFFAQLDAFLKKHLTQEQTTQVVNEFRKNCQLMVDSMNFEDIERFAASNFTEF